MTRRVLVVGAGIAGLAMARALRDVEVEVTVVERRSGAPSPGLGLNLPGNAVRAMGALGVAEQVLDAGVPVNRREYRTTRDRLLFAVDESAFWSGVASSVCLRRGRLLDALGTDQQVRRGVGVMRVDVCPDGPHVVLSDGTHEVYDLVVGADGVHSTVRGAIANTTPRASAMTTASWRFVVPNPGIDCWTAWTGGGLAMLLIPGAPGRSTGTPRVAGEARREQTPVGSHPRMLGSLRRLAGPCRRPSTTPRRPTRRPWRRSGSTPGIEVRSS